MVQNTRIKARIEEIQSQAEADKIWWEKKRSATRSEFLKELDVEDTDSKVDTESRRPSVAPSSVAGDKPGSDSDGVLVDADSNSTGSPTTPNTPSQSGGKKKKKNNKK